jgi:hypothetical protein
MKPMSMRQRLLAVIQGRELDRVPLIMYDDLFPSGGDEVRAGYGDRIGLLRWSAVHRVETPHCHVVTEEYFAGETRCEHSTLFTPAGSLSQERAFEPIYNSGAFKKRYIEEPQDYEVLWAYLEDALILEDYARYHRDQARLGEEGLPLAAVERTPFQQLWVEWIDIDRLSFHFADCPDRVYKTIEMLNARARKIFDIACQSPAPMINFPDNITAPMIGLKRFLEFNVPLYNELADRLAEKQAPVFVHMDGNLKPLWGAIAASKVGGLDSFSPTPDNDTSVADAVALWPDKRLFVNMRSALKQNASWKPVDIPAAWRSNSRRACPTLPGAPVLKPLQMPLMTSDPDF